MLNIFSIDDMNQYKAQWNDEKIVTIHNILSNDYATQLNHYLLNLPDNKWNVSIHPYMTNIYTFSNTEENKTHIINGTISANNSYDKGEFSYCFRRYDNYENDGIKIKELMLSQDYLQLINNITQLNVNTVISVFGSMYTENSFLSTHTDTGRGKIAFVLNLTKDWNENDGGCFELLEHDWCHVKKRVCPQFNSLTIFNVEENGVPHRVTRINPDVKDKRIAFSGWLI